MYIIGTLKLLHNSLIHSKIDDKHTHMCNNLLLYNPDKKDALISWNWKIDSSIRKNFKNLPITNHRKVKIDSVDTSNVEIKSSSKSRWAPCNNERMKSSIRYIGTVNNSDTNDAPIAFSNSCFEQNYIVIPFIISPHVMNM